MDFNSFVYGIITMCSIGLLIGYVLIILKIKKLDKDIVFLKEMIKITESTISSVEDSASKQLYFEIDKVSDSIKDIYSYIDSRVDKLITKLK